LGLTPLLRSKVAWVCRISLERQIRAFLAGKTFKGGLGRNGGGAAGVHGQRTNSTDVSGNSTNGVGASGTSANNDGVHGASTCSPSTANSSDENSTVSFWCTANYFLVDVLNLCQSSALHKEYDMAMKRSLVAACAILVCLMFAWATGAGRPYPASAGGVTDPTCTSSSPCIEYDNNGTGSGVKSLSVIGNGLNGTTKVHSTSAANGRAGLFGNDQGTGSFNSGVHGQSVDGTGVSGSSTSGVGVTAQSTNAQALNATSSKHDGIRAFTLNNSMTSGFGASGVFGQDISSDGGHLDAGVAGFSNTGVGVVGLSSNWVGVNAIGGDHPGTGGIFPALSVVGNTAGGSSNNDLIDACSPGTVNPCDHSHGVFDVDGYGNVRLSGAIEAVDIDAHGAMQVAQGVTSELNFAILGTGEYIKNGLCVAGCGSSATSARRVRTYSPQSSQPMIEDNGEAQLVNGAAYVRVDPGFANVVDQRSNYSVSITPEGNSNGLFVTQKTLNGFAVRENNGGRSTLAFEYRIVAKPFGSTAKRLPMVDVSLRRTIGARSRYPRDIVPVR
jgi:hypothetical protein